MTELIELRRFKPIVSYPLLTANEILSDSSDDEVFHTLPMITNSQPIRYREHEVFAKPIFEPLPSQYLPSTSFTTMIDKRPLVYQRVHTPTLIEEHPRALYRSCRTPVRRVIQVSPSSPSPQKNVHLPKHAKQLVNRFLNNLEQAHDHQIDENESDSSIDGCYICRQLRSAMNDGKQRSISEQDTYRSSRVVFEAQNSFKCGHSKNCNVCNLLEKSNFGISNRSKQDKHVHVINTFPSNNQVKLNYPPIYPTGYTTFVDPNTGLTYAYDPNWQYDTNPIYIPSNPQIYPSTMDKSTYTRMTSGDDRHKSNDKTVIVHTSRNPTPRTPKIVIEQPRRHHRKSRKNRSTTIVKERIPRTKTTTYI